jgi:hypothetical protein
MATNELSFDDMRESFYKKYSQTLKSLQIEIRQQNENVRLYNLYVGFNRKPLMLHTMALKTKDEARILGFTIIELGKGLIPEITWVTY